MAPAPVVPPMLWRPPTDEKFAKVRVPLVEILITPVPEMPPTLRVPPPLLTAPPV